MRSSKNFEIPIYFTRTMVYTITVTEFQEPREVSKMAGKYFTMEDIRKMMTEKVKDYLDQGWYFNFKYMSCSNGYEFAAVTDGKDTIVIYFQFKQFGKASSLNVEKFTDNNNEYENIWVGHGRGEIIETTQLLYKYETETYAIVKGYDSKERSKKHLERVHSRTDFEDKAISEPMKEALANYIKKQGIPGLKRFKASDINGHYCLRQNKYILKIKDRRVHINRDKYVVSVI